MQKQIQWIARGGTDDVNIQKFFDQMCCFLLNKLDDNFHDDDFIRAERRRKSAWKIFFSQMIKQRKNLGYSRSRFSFFKEKKIQARRGFEPPSTWHYTSPPRPLSVRLSYEACNNSSVFKYLCPSKCKSDTFVSVTF